VDGGLGAGNEGWKGEGGGEVKGVRWVKGGRGEEVRLR
jgi:hypothetical protein